ncbi:MULTISPECIES: hypothetical protein [Microcystis]|uniref:hypothetical protein n=1 Tax=Microcystis TaxID=1125 RepID=UPI00123161AA|nr:MULTISPECIES: hypothetical protein [Microcystis]
MINYEVVIIDDREFHSVKLAYWLKQPEKEPKIFFAFQQKKGTNYQKNGQDYQTFSELNLVPGMKRFCN